MAMSLDSEKNKYILCCGVLHDKDDIMLRFFPW